MINANACAMIVKTFLDARTHHLLGVTLESDH